jgi:multiple sugar transport system ATP-binding protein
VAGLSLRHLNKSYGAQPILQDFGLEVADGEFLCLLGPSGSGKSTLLRAIAGLETLQDGQIFIGEREVSGLQPRDRNVGMTFQGYALYPHMSVRRNLAYPLSVRHVGRAEIDRRVAETARLLGIAHLLGRRVQQISGGEQQRVAIGRAIIQKPQLYLLDEPISNLDASLRESVRTEIRRLQQELRATMIMVTHDQLDALAIADRIAVLHRGALQQIGAPTELYERPINLFVASFIGRLRMNFLTGRLETSSSAGHAVVRGEGFALNLPESAAAVIPGAVSEVTIGVRPEAFDLLRAAALDAAPGRVLTVQFHGDQTVCTAQVGQATVQAIQTSRDRLSPGAEVWLRPRPGQMHVFATTTGARMA